MNVSRSAAVSYIATRFLPLENVTPETAASSMTFVKHDLKESVEVFMGRNLDPPPPQMSPTS
jgi:hypothetical protein